MSSEVTGSDLKIVFGEKDDTLIVLLMGQLRSQEAKDLDDALPSIAERAQTNIIISLRDVENFLPGAHGAFARLQTGLRKAGKNIGVCSIKPDVKVSLIAAGVIRESEMFNNIPLAWEGLKKKVILTEKLANASAKKAA